MKRQRFVHIDANALRIFVNDTEAYESIRMFYISG